MTTDTPRVYVACLASYNAGRLFGEWVDATDADTIRERIAEILAKSPTPGAEEWAIHDYDGIPSTFGENPDLDKLAEYAAAFEEHGEAWEVYVGNVGAKHATVDDFQESYEGEHSSPEAFAESLVEDSGMLAGVDETIARYFDYEAFARDLFCGDYYFVNGHVFRSV